MRFVDLVQRLAMEASIAIPTSAQNQTASAGRVVTWINSAWNDIQTMRDDWDWMRSSALLGAGCNFTPVAGQKSFPLGTTGTTDCGVAPAVFGKWAEHTFRSYTTTVGTNSETRLDRVDFDVWRETYMYGANQGVKTKPVAIAFGPDKSICLGPTSNGTYNVYGDYFVAPTLMVNDTDVPFGLPPQYHILIVWKALFDYGGYEAAPEVIAKADMHWTKGSRELMRTNSPRMTFAGALA